MAKLNKDLIKGNWLSDGLALPLATLRTTTTRNAPLQSPPWLLQPGFKLISALVCFLRHAGGIVSTASM